MKTNENYKELTNKQVLAALVKELESEDGKGEEELVRELVERFTDYLKS